jgi:hypothetical protein
LAFARKITLEPHRFDDADMAALKQRFTDLQILEMLLSVCGNNSINRWKEGLGVPQSAGGGGGLGRRGAGGEAAREDSKHSYETPTSPAFRTARTAVAPFDAAPPEAATAACRFRRPPLESRADAERALAAAAARTPRLPLANADDARAAWGEGAPASLPQWALLLANFPKDGKARIAGIRAAENKGDLSPLLKAQVAWAIARQDRAWYAAAEARARLHALGYTDDQVFALDGDGAGLTPAERAQLVVARHLAASPVVLTDEEFAAALKLVGPRDMVQLVSYITNRASFDRLTEAAGLAAGK